MIAVVPSIRERSERFTAPELREGAAVFIDVFEVHESDALVSKPDRGAIWCERFALRANPTMKKVAVDTKIGR